MTTTTDTRTTTIDQDVVHDAAQAAPVSAATPQPQPHTQPQPLDQRNANAFAISSFILGLVSIVAGWSFFAPITGLVLGIIALRRGTGERTLALWGVWLNGVLLALSALAVLVFVGVLGLGVLAAAV